MPETELELTDSDAEVAAEALADERQTLRQIIESENPDAEVAELVDTEDDTPVDAETAQNIGAYQKLGRIRERVEEANRLPVYPEWEAYVPDVLRQYVSPENAELDERMFRLATRYKEACANEN